MSKVAKKKKKETRKKKHFPSKTHLTELLTFLHPKKLKFESKLKLNLKSILKSPVSIAEEHFS